MLWLNRNWRVWTLGKQWAAVRDLLRWKVPFGLFPILLPAIMLWPDFDWWELLVLALGSLCTVLMVHVVDDIFGFLSGTDKLNEEQKEEIGHPKPIVRGDISINTAIIIASLLASGVMVSAILLLFYFDNSLWLLPMGAFTVLWAYSYSGWPLKLSYHGMGETVLLMCGGVMPVMISYYVLSGRISLEAIWVGAFIGGLFSSILFSAQQADIEGDLSSDRLTLTARIYKRSGHKGVNEFLVIYQFMWGFFWIAGCVFGIVPMGLVFIGSTLALFIPQHRANERGDFYRGRNLCLRAWQATFAILCLSYAIKNYWSA